MNIGGDEDEWWGVLVIKLELIKELVSFDIPCKIDQ